MKRKKAEASIKSQSDLGVKKFKNQNSSVKSRYHSKLSAVITRADGTVEDLGVVSEQEKVYILDENKVRKIAKERGATKEQMGLIDEILARLKR